MSTTDMTRRNTRTRGLRVRGAVALAGAAPACALAVFTASAGSAVAPEPARLDGQLSGQNSWAHAVYTQSQTPTYGVQFSRSWTTGSSVPVGAPCADYAAGPGTILPGVIIASGSWKRCAISAY